MPNSDKLIKLMNKHDWTKADVARILGYAPSTAPSWTNGNMTVHRMINVPGYTPGMGWDNVFILLDAYVKKKKK